MISYTTFYLSFCKNKKEKIFSLINGSFHFVRRLTNSRTSGINQRNFSFRQSRKKYTAGSLQESRSKFISASFRLFILEFFWLGWWFLFYFIFYIIILSPLFSLLFSLSLSLLLNIYLSHSVHTYTWVIEWQNGKNKNSNLS